MCSLSLKFGDHPVQRPRMRGFCSEREKQRLFLEEDQGRSQGGRGRVRKKRSATASFEATNTGNECSYTMKLGVFS